MCFVICRYVISIRMIDRTLIAMLQVSRYCAFMARCSTKQRFIHDTACSFCIVMAYCAVNV